MKMKTLIGKILFGSIFVVIIPVLLIAWAHFTASDIALPVPSNKIVNFFALAIGAFFVIAGMHNLWFYGDGLPMNAFPPKNFVKNGAYSIVKNPIYFGTAIMSFSISAIAQSSAGFWFISPLFTLMIIAYTIGFENERNIKIFGQQPYKPFLSLSERSNEIPSPKNRIAAFILVYLPWLLIYESFIFIGVPKGAIYSNLPFESNLPLIEFTVVVYVATYLYAVIIPFVIKSKEVLRSFEIDVWLATGISATLYFTIPFIVKQPQITPHSIWGDILLFDRTNDGISAAFPAFHVIWAFIAAQYFSASKKKLKWMWYMLAVLISISCITTGNHSIIDVIAGIGVYFITRYKMQIWNFIRSQSERIANSWREWRFGSVRVINHGFYAGASGFVGILIIG